MCLCVLFFFQLKVERVHVGSFVTSLDMHGLSLTLLDLDAVNPAGGSILDLLDAPADAPGWNSASAAVLEKVRCLSRELDLCIVPALAQQDNFQ